MLKNIFRSRKKSKSGLTTPSSKDVNNQVPFSLSKTKRDPILPVPCGQLNNEISHSERAIDVPYEKHVLCSVNASSSKDDIETAAAVGGKNVIPSSMAVVNSFSESPLSKQVKPINRETDKENKENFESGRKTTFSYSLQKENATDVINRSYGSQHAQWKTDKSLSLEFSGFNSVNKIPEILLLNDNENSHLAASKRSAASTIGVTVDEERMIIADSAVEMDKGTNAIFSRQQNHRNCTDSNISSRANNNVVDHEGSSFILETHCLEKVRNKFETVEDSEDVIPQLVPYHVNHVNKNDTILSQSASRECFTENTVNIANESEMFIITDSFLDNSSASFMNATNKWHTSPRLDSSIMVVDDYTPQVDIVPIQQRSFSSDVGHMPITGCDSSLGTRVEEPFVRVSPDRKSVQQNGKLISNDAMQKSWQYKPVRDWSSDEVLMWVNHVGLEEFYEAFKNNGIVGRDISVISTKLLDRLEIFRFEQRERVLNRLYLLHAPGFTCYTATDNSSSSRAGANDNGKSQAAVAGAVSVAIRTDYYAPKNLTETSLASCTGVVKQLNFDEMSLTSSRDYRLVNEKSDFKLNCLPDDDNSVNNISTSSGHSQISSSQNASNQSPEQDCCMEILKTEYADLLSQLSEAKDAILSKDLLIKNLQKNNSEVKCQVNGQVEPAELPCLHDVLPSNAVASVVAINLDLTKTGSRGFMLGLDSNDRPIIKHVEQNVPLKRGDRILEVNRCNVLHLSESQLYKHLNSVEDGLKVVVLRLPDSKQRHSSEDIDSLKEDLTLALMELESVQLENKDLSNEINRLRKNCEELDNDESFDVFDRNDD